MEFRSIKEANESELMKLANRLFGYEVVDKDLKPLMDFLSSSDYYYAPASTKYHGNYPGGLYDHCKGLYRELQEFKMKMKKNWDDRDLFMIAFMHDLCKVGNYEAVVDDSGNLTYNYKSQSPQSKHGLRSLEMLSELIPHMISKEAAHSILYHMGLYTTDVNNAAEEIKKCQSENDLVFFTHAADMIESRMSKKVDCVRLLNDEVFIKI